jgi:hypothetical protein
MERNIYFSLGYMARRFGSLGGVCKSENIVEQFQLNATGEGASRYEERRAGDACLIRRPDPGGDGPWLFRELALLNYLSNLGFGLGDIGLSTVKRQGRAAGLGLGQRFGAGLQPAVALRAGDGNPQAVGQTIGHGMTDAQ